MKLRTKTIKRPNKGGTVVITPDYERAIRLINKHKGIIDAAKLVHHRKQPATPLDFPHGEFIQIWDREEVRRNSKVPVKVFYWVRERPGVERVAYCHHVMLGELIKKLDGSKFK